MDISALATSATAVAVAAIGAFAGRLSASRKSRELADLMALFELTESAAIGSPERQVLHAHLIYEAEFFAARNSGRDKWTYIVNIAATGLAVAGAGFFYWQTYQAIEDFPNDYSLQAMLVIPALVTSGVALVFGGRVDRIGKEREALKKQKQALKKVRSRENLKQAGLSDKLIDQIVR